MLPDFVRNEVNRQKMLLEVKKILGKRGVKPIAAGIVDATDVFRECPSKIVTAAIKSKGAVLAVKLPGFAGVMNGENGRLRLGAEMAQRARTHGVKGIFHSDELPNYGIDMEYVDALKVYLGISSPEDAFVICAAPEATAREALVAAVDRANEALEGIPEETRDPLPDGTTKYSRPLPGAARMYPETDVPPTLITEEKAAEIRASIPEFPEQIEKRLVEQYGINAQQAHQMLRESNYELFERLAGAHRGLSSVVATTLTNTYSELEREGIAATEIPESAMIGTFDMLAHSKFAKEALPDILREVSKGTTPQAAVSKLGLEAVEEDEATRIVASIVREREDFVRSKGMEAIGPLMGPVMAALRGKIDGKAANDILAKEISKLIG